MSCEIKFFDFENSFVDIALDAENIWRTEVRAVLKKGDQVAYLYQNAFAMTYEPNLLCQLT